MDYERGLREEIRRLCCRLREEVEGEERKRISDLKLARIHDLLNFDPHLRRMYRRNQDPTGVIGNAGLE